MRIEDVDIVDAHPLQALVEAGQDIFAAAEFAVRSRPHAIAGLGRDDEFITMAGEVRAQYVSKGLLGRSRRRTIVIGEIEVRDAQVEGAPADGPGIVKDRILGEVVPETQRQEGEIEAAPAAAAIMHAVIAVRSRLMAHMIDLDCWKSLL